MSQAAPPLHPLLVIAGPTASGKSALALHLALHGAGHWGGHGAGQIAPQLQAEIVSCDSVAVYRQLDIGSAKAGAADRARVPHHGLDLYDPDGVCTAGDYARAGRAALAAIRARGHLPIVVGGTGLYLRALLEGLDPAPPRDEVLRERLRARAQRRGTENQPRGAGTLHRLLTRFDPRAAAAIHPHDTPKLIRSLEVTLAGRRPQTAQWETGREPIEGFRILALGLDPPRAALYARINDRAAGMFRQGLLEETEEAAARFGSGCASLRSLGYTQALAVLGGETSLPEAIAIAQQGHRHYAKRQLTWFRKQLRSLPAPAATHWLPGFGDEAAVQARAAEILGTFLHAAPF